MKPSSNIFEDLAQSALVGLVAAIAIVAFFPSPIASMSVVAWLFLFVMLRGAAKSKENS